MNTPPVYVGYQPVFCERIHFKLSTGAAATYTGSATLPAGSLLVDILVHQVALWNSGTSASLKIGDAADDDGFLVGVDMKATDLLAGESINLYAAGGQQGADVDDVAAPGSHIRRRYLSTQRVITATLTLAGTAATTGETFIDILFTYPSGPHAEKFVAV